MPDRWAFRFGDRDRLGAALATGVLALSGAVTATSVASETDSQQEGGATQPTAPSEEVGRGSEAETALPVDVEPVLGDPEQETAPDGAAPSGDIPLDFAAPEAVTPGGAGPGEEQEDAVPDGAGPEVGQPGGDPRGGSPRSGGRSGDAVPEGGRGTAPLPVDPPATPTSPEAAPEGSAAHILLIADPGIGQGTPTLRMRKAHAAGNSSRARSAPGTADQTPSEGRSLEVVAATPAEPATVRAAAPLRLEGRRFHVVRRGESLWAIAAALVGREQSADVVARQVRRLWRLNRARIGTGDPNVLPVGVRLRLR